MTLATKNGAIILKDGKLAEDCACCGGWYCYPPCCVDRALTLTISNFSWTFTFSGVSYDVFPEGVVTIDGQHSLVHPEKLFPNNPDSGGVIANTLRSFVQAGCTSQLQANLSLDMRCHERIGLLVPAFVNGIPLTKPTGSHGPGGAVSCGDTAIRAFATPESSASQCPSAMLSFHGTYIDKCYEVRVLLAANWFSEIAASRSVGGSHSSSFAPPHPYNNEGQSNSLLQFDWSLS